MKIVVGFLFLALSVTANADVYEIVTWKFKPGTSEQMATEATKGLDIFLRSIKGFKTRSTYYSKESNQWVDVVIWKDLESAKAALVQSENHQSYKAFMPLVDEKSVNLSHYDKK